MTTYKAKVSEHSLLCGSFQYVRLELITPNRIEFQAGQYIIITVDKEKGIRRDYSIASAPMMNHAVDLLVDVKPQGDGSQYVAHLVPGDTVEFAGPFGNFVVDEGCLKRSDLQLLFVATGSGISPVRSMILDLLQAKKYQRQIRLWWGMRREEDCFWVEDFDGLEREYKNFKWDLVLSQPPEDWPLHSGYVTKHVLSYAQNMQQSAINNQQSACFYLCGNRLMIEELSTKLAETGINTQHIHTEKFF